MSEISNTDLTASAHLALEMYTLPNDSSWNRIPARGFYVTNNGDLETAESGADSYEVLALLGRRALPNHAKALGLHTSGWASPIDEINPSEHPERRRVELIVLVDRTLRVVSVARLEDSPEVLNSEDGEGPVADALTAAMALSMRRALIEEKHESEG